MDEVYLRPGEIFFGHGQTVKTLLGSCVSVVVWVREAGCGGMCHGVLPGGHEARKGDPRYVDQAIEWLAEKVREIGHDPRRCWAGLYGGANMFRGLRIESAVDIGQRNVQRARLRMRECGLVAAEEYVGGYTHRHITFNTETGEIVVRQRPPDADLLEEGA